MHALVRLHIAGMHATSPPESVHSYGLEQLRAPGVTVWSAWRGEDLLGIAALAVLPDGAGVTAGDGEVKSMRTDPRHVGQGVGRALLHRIVDHARANGLRRLLIETGNDDTFVPAHRLYRSAGFVPCGPFAHYVEDPHSCFFVHDLRAG